MLQICCIKWTNLPNHASCTDLSSQNLSDIRNTNGQKKHTCFTSLDNTITSSRKLWGFTEWQTLRLRHLNSSRRTVVGDPSYCTCAARQETFRKGYWELLWGYFARASNTLRVQAVRSMMLKNNMWSCGNGVPWWSADMTTYKDEGLQSCYCFLLPFLVRGTTSLWLRQGMICTLVCIGYDSNQEFNLDVLMLVWVSRHAFCCRGGHTKMTSGYGWIKVQHIQCYNNASWISGNTPKTHALPYYILTMQALQFRGSWISIWSSYILAQFPSPCLSSICPNEA